MAQKLKILLVEDSESDAALLLRELTRGGFEPDWRRVDSEDGLRKALDEPWDAVVSDYSLPGFNALGALKLVRERDEDLPFIVVTGTLSEEAAVACLKAGAQDFMTKDKLQRFVPAVGRELKEAQVRRERAIARKALHYSEVRYRSIVETAREGIVLLDAEDRVLFCNAPFLGLVGVTELQAAGKQVFALLGEAGAMVEPRWKAHTGAGRDEPLRVECPLARESGRVWASLALTATYDEDGRHQGGLLTAWDNTEQRRMRDRLAVTDLMASVGALAAGVSHEINNPLAVVLGNLDLTLTAVDELARKGAFGAEAAALREGLKDAVAAAMAVRDIAHDLKVFSAGVTDKPAAVAVAPVLETAMRMAWNEIRHRARLVKEIQPAPPVLGFAPNLGQVFLNLIVLAARSIEEGKAMEHRVTVRLREAEPGWVAIEVQDTGKGMGQQERRALVAGAEPEGASEAWIGLSVCHRLVADMGGRLEVESQPELGSLYRVLLPAAQAGGPAAAPAGEAPLAPRRARIWVVDDDLLVGRVIQRVLGATHDVSSSASARVTLEALEAGAPCDLILCDLMMPDMTGMEFYEALRERLPLLAPKVVFLSGGAFTPKAREFIASVPNMRLEKPFEMGALRAVVDKALGQ